MRYQKEFIKRKHPEKQKRFNLQLRFLGLSIFIFLVKSLCPGQAYPAYDLYINGKPGLVIYQGSFRLRPTSFHGENSSRRPVLNPLQDNDYGEFELSVGGSLQADYRYYEEACREDSRFDIRRARISFSGRINRLIFYQMKLEFQGSDQKNLLDAFGDIKFYQALSLKFGQFKEPFSLEWQTQDEAVFFAERSMGYYLSPNRDVGMMIYGSVPPDNYLAGIFNFHYLAGIFNGDGIDGSSRGSQSDDPEFTGRLVLSFFENVPGRWMKSIHIGGSGTHAHIDLANVSLEVKSAGMVGTNRSIYKLNANTKFGVLKSVHERRRLAVDGGLAFGPVVLEGEYVDFRFTELEPAGSLSREARFFTWYGSIIIFITGEAPEFKYGMLQPVSPPKNSYSWLGRLGMLGIGFRREHFSGDESWIMPDAFSSVGDADAYSIALNWIITPTFRFILDYTDTYFSDPIRVRIDPKNGNIDYIEAEHVTTARFDIHF
ncbi:MAG: OprO/OprP family phosphate-selective porin [bacterium]